MKSNSRPAGGLFAWSGPEYPRPNWLFPESYNFAFLHQLIFVMDEFPRREMFKNLLAAWADRALIIWSGCFTCLELLPNQPLARNTALFPPLVKTGSQKPRKNGRTQLNTDVQMRTSLGGPFGKNGCSADHFGMIV